jgi:hypothetical protein
MKKKLVLVSGFLVIGLLALGAKMVVAAVTTLPRLTTACETKVGGVLMGIDDGFSSLKTCPGNSRKVNLGEGSQGGSKIFTENDVVFVYNIAESRYILKGDGKVWKGSMTKVSDNFEWERVAERDLPVGITVNDLYSWTSDTFSTKSGEIWASDRTYNYGDFNYSGWIKIGDGSSIL